MAPPDAPQSLGLLDVTCAGVARSVLSECSPIYLSTALYQQTEPADMYNTHICLWRCFFKRLITILTADLRAG
jgi:hypothetical protein